MLLEKLLGLRKSLLNQACTFQERCSKGKNSSQTSNSLQTNMVCISNRQDIFFGPVMRPGRGGTERKEWANLRVFFQGGGAGSCREGREAHASKKKKKSVNWNVCNIKKEYASLLLAKTMITKKKDYFTFVVFLGLGSGFGGAGFCKTFLVAQHVKHTTRCQPPPHPASPPPYTFPYFLLKSMHLAKVWKALLHKCTSSLNTPVCISSLI